MCSRTYASDLPVLLSFVLAYDVYMSNLGSEYITQNQVYDRLLLEERMLFGGNDP